MSVGSWILTALFVGVLSPLIAFAALVHAAWTALRRRLAAHL
jgi:hypothetical protein